MILREMFPDQEYSGEAVSGVGPDLTATMNGNYDPPIRYCANILLITPHHYTQIFLHLLSTDITPSTME